MEAGQTNVQLQVAFAGHSRPGDLGNLEALEAKVEQALHRLRAAGIKHARLMTGLAEGADKMVAEAWRRRDMGPTHAVLPFLDEAEELVGPGAVAQTATWLDGEQAHEIGCSPHLVQTRWMLSHAELLIVVWNGLEGRGAGGTADAVRLALDAGVPILWINPREPELNIIRRPPLHDPVSFLELHETLQAGRGSIVAHADVETIREALELARPQSTEIEVRGHSGFENWLHRWLWRSFWVFQRMAGGRLPPAKRPAIPPPADLAAQPGFIAIGEAFAVADAHAGRLAAIHRSEQILLLGAAVAAATLGALPYFNYALKVPAIVAELILAIAAFGVWRVSDRARWHEKWTGARRLAEHLRLAQVGWALGVATGRAGSAALQQEHRRLGRAILRQAQPAHGRYDPRRIAAWASWGVHELVNGQADYHRREGHRNHLIAKRIQLVENGSFAILVLVLATAAIAAAVAASMGHHAPGWATSMAGAVGVIAPAIGAAAMALEAKLQFEEQAERSSAVAARLETLADALPSDLTLEAAQGAIRASAELLVAEADQWQEGGGRRRLFRG